MKEEEKKELARGEGVPGRRNSTCTGLGPGRSAKNSKKCNRTGAKEKGECGKRRWPFPRLPAIGRQSQGGIQSSGSFIQSPVWLFNQKVADDLLCARPGLGAGETETKMGTT